MGREARVRKQRALKNGKEEEGKMPSLPYEFISAKELGENARLRKRMEKAGLVIPEGTNIVTL